MLLFRRAVPDTGAVGCGGGGGGTDDTETARRRGGGWRHSAPQKDLLRRLCTLNKQAMALRKEQWPALSRRLGSWICRAADTSPGLRLKLERGFPGFFSPPAVPKRENSSASQTSFSQNTVGASKRKIRVHESNETTSPEQCRAQLESVDCSLHFGLQPRRLKSSSDSL